MEDPERTENLESKPLFPDWLLPASILDFRDKLNRDFLWGSRKLYLINWEDISHPKALGGLSILVAKFRNQALIMKLGWRLVH
ncbi:reverse transcriptase like protein [Gossypium australe]|uniref:Reverse transcriptase like protein n=1 Tax=Gossypium australe TaxID=47621 RepID=A0A5B6X921_9ROSI|nr:reverse transcriptase like protein [Gossypium australe]